MRRFLTHSLPFLAWTALILSAANDAMSSRNTGHFLGALLGWLSPGALAVVNFVMRKLTHVVVYGIEGLLAARAIGGNRVAGIVIACAVAITDETMQSTTMLRTGNAGDVLLDTIAAAVFTMFLRR